MRRIRLIVSYDGTGYFGSQIQPNAVTVEQKLNEAVQGLTGAPAQVVFASRTDTGVHALGNVAVFDTEFLMRAERFATALNAYLPQDGCRRRMKLRRFGTPENSTARRPTNTASGTGGL